MTPKEKAEELVNKFIRTNGNAFFAKECALVVVNELVLETAIHTDHSFLSSDDNKNRPQFWIKVKQEIEKL